MSTILNSIVNQLYNTFWWGLFGLILGVIVIIFLKKATFSKKRTPIQLVKWGIYYLIFPIGISLTFWFYAATKNVEQTAILSANTTINYIEKSLYPSFDKHIAKNLKHLSDTIDIRTNEKIILNFIKNHQKTTSSNKKIIYNALLNYTKSIALEKKKKNITQVNLNNNVSENTYTNYNEFVYNLPFKQIRGFTYKQIHSYTKQLYIIYYISYCTLFLIILIEISFILLRKRY